MKQLISLLVVTIFMMTTTGLLAQNKSPGKNWEKLGENDSLITESLSINSPRDDYAPIFINGVLYFTSDRKNRTTDELVLQYSENIYTSSYVDSTRTWSSPKKSYFWNSDDHTAIAGYSRDGYLFTYKTFGGGDLYCSSITGKLSAPKRMKKPINSDAHEQSIAKANGIIVISSERKGGQGGHDLYCVQENEKGEYTNPTPLSMVNSPGDEVDVSFSSSGKTLYFSSNGLGGSGGYDIFFTVLDENGYWSIPKALSINTEADDRFFMNCDSMYFITTPHPESGDDNLYWGHIVPKRIRDTVSISRIEPLNAAIDTNLVVENLFQFNERPTEQVFYTPEGKPDTLREQKFLKIYDHLDSLQFEVRTAYVQIGAYYYLQSIDEFKYNYPAFDTTSIFVEKVVTKRGTLYKYIIDKEYKTLKESAIRQQEAILLQTDQANRYKITQGDAFIAVYNEKSERILIYFNVYTGACRIIKDGYKPINF